MGTRVVTHTFGKEMEMLRLYPIADVHLGASNCKEKEFAEYLKAIEKDEQGYVILAGDLINNGIKGSKTDVYFERYTPAEQKYKMAEYLRPLAKAGKILGAVGGNHEYRTMRDVCQDLGRDLAMMCGYDEVYARNAVFLKITLGHRINSGRQVAYMIYLSHGCGGGQLIGSGINRQDKFQMAVEGVDISITGHTHKPMKAPSGRLVFDPYNNMVSERNTLIFVCTAWLNYGDYAVRTQLVPTAFYPDTIEISGRGKSWR